MFFQPRSLAGFFHCFRTADKGGALDLFSPRVPKPWAASRRPPTQQVERTLSVVCDSRHSFSKQRASVGDDFSEGFGRV